VPRLLAAALKVLKRHGAIGVSAIGLQLPAATPRLGSEAETPHNRNDAFEFRGALAVSKRHTARKCAEDRTRACGIEVAI
jgi:hypothetical protein